MAQWAVVEREVIQGFFRFSPAHARSAGDHRFDGVVGDASRTALQARTEEIDRHLRLLNGADGINTSQDIDRRALVAHLETARFELVELRRPFREPMFYAGFGTELDVSPYLKRPYGPLPDRLQALRRHLAGYPGYLEAARDNLDASLPRPNLAIAIEAAAGQLAYLEGEVRQQARDDAQTVRAVEQAAAQTRSFVGFLKSRAAKAHDDYALGEERFLQLLRIREGIGLGVSDLQGMVSADIERNRAAAAAAAEQVAPGAGIPQALRQLQDHHPSSASIIPEVSAMLDGLRAFIQERDLVTIPSGSACVVRPTPSFIAFITAAMDSAGPLETTATDSYYYVTVPAPTWSELKSEEWLRHLNYATLANTSIHEAYPGHYVQSLHERRAASLTRQLFTSQASVEGFAHYCEQMMLDAGYSTDPRLKLAQCLDALLRDCRFLVSLGLHCQRMPMAEAIRVFMSVGFLSELPATREAMRGAWDPLYLNYTLGKLLIMQLRRDLARSGYSLKRFHDAFLDCGGLPVPMIRELLTDTASLPGNGGRI